MINEEELTKYLDKVSKAINALLAENKVLRIKISNLEKDNVKHKQRVEKLTADLKENTTKVSKVKEKMSGIELKLGQAVMKKR